MSEPWLDAISDPELAPRDGWTMGAFGYTHPGLPSLTVWPEAPSGDLSRGLYIERDNGDTCISVVAPVTQARDALRSLHRSWELLERERKTWGSVDSAHAPLARDPDGVQKRQGGPEVLFARLQHIHDSVGQVIPDVRTTAELSRWLKYLQAVTRGELDAAIVKGDDGRDQLPRCLGRDGVQKGQGEG